MSDWHECPNAQECTEGNRFGRGCVADPVQSAMGGKPWHECHCGVDSDGNPPNVRQAYTITALRAEVEDLGNRLHHVHRLWANNEHALRAEVERLKVESIQMQAALGYAIRAEDERHILPSNPFKCGTCDASKRLRAENEKLRAALHRISLGSQNSGTTKEDLGREARAAITQPAEKGGE